MSGMRVASVCNGLKARSGIIKDEVVSRPVDLWDGCWAFGGDPRRTYPETSFTISRTKAVLLLRWPFVLEIRGLTSRRSVFCRADSNVSQLIPPTQSLFVEPLASTPL